MFIVMIEFAKTKSKKNGLRVYKYDHEQDPRSDVLA